jgi:hypothetical protein
MSTNGDGPAIVIYIVNPFTYGHQDWDDLNRLAMIGLLKCYQEIVQKLPEHMQKNVYLQVIIVHVPFFSRHWLSYIECFLNRLCNFILPLDLYQFTKMELINASDTYIESLSDNCR